jgi:hypothetical protein
MLSKPLSAGCGEAVDDPGADETVPVDAPDVTVVDVPPLVHAAATSAAIEATRSRVRAREVTARDPIRPPRIWRSVGPEGRE